MAPVLDFDPAVRPASAIDAFPVFRHQPLQPHQASVAEQVRSDLALFERRNVDAVNPPRQQPSEVGLAHRQRRLAQILAVVDQHVERIELHLIIVLAAVQAVEIRSPVDAQQQGLAVDHERAVAISKCGLGDQRKPAAPVVAVTGERQIFGVDSRVLQMRISRACLNFPPLVHIVITGQRNGFI